MVRITMLALLVLATVASWAAARNYTGLSRQQIRSMPILERPSRPGHFYGNAVRRRHQRSMEQAGHYGYPAYRGTVWTQDAPVMQDGATYQTGETYIVE
ncbi:MAG: hypothetical protein DWQ37_07925 [Planctomycetota bacterium]|nr:MAG: hypothetical protein DWQ37_07925 [Planctomycetota bacterium]